MTQFENVKSIVIPDGTVKKLTVGSDDVWQKRAQRIPAEYQELSYVRVTGSQYLQTNYTPVQNVEFTFENFSITVEAGVTQCILSAGTSTNQLCLNWSTVSTIQYFQPGKLKCSGYDVKHRHIYINGTGWLFDGECMLTGGWYENTVNTQLRFFRHAGGSNPCVNASVGDIWVTKSQVTIKHYIPALRLSDSRAGFYETVSGSFCLSSGTDDFVAGTPI